MISGETAADSSSAEGEKNSQANGPESDETLERRLAPPKGHPGISGNLSGTKTGHTTVYVVYPYFV